MVQKWILSNDSYIPETPTSESVVFQIVAVCMFLYFRISNHDFLSSRLPSCRIPSCWMDGIHAICLSTGQKVVTESLRKYHRRPHRSSSRFLMGQGNYTLTTAYCHPFWWRFPIVVGNYLAIVLEIERHVIAWRLFLCFFSPASPWVNLIFQLMVWVQGTVTFLGILRVESQTTNHPKPTSWVFFK